MFIKCNSLRWAFLILSVLMALSVFTTAGADECGGTPLVTGDLNRDCYVNLSDLVIFSNFWQQCSRSDDVECLKLLGAKAQLVYPVKLPTASGVQLFAGSPTVKVFSSEDINARTNLMSATLLELSLAKNETEPFILTLNPSVELTAVTLSFDGLSGPAFLPASVWSWHRILEVDVPGTSNWYGISGSETGLVPDPLVPGESFTAAVDKNHSLLITIGVPTSAAAGLYQSNIHIQTSAGLLTTLPVQIEVWDIELPEARSMRTGAPSLGSGGDAAQSLLDFGVTDHKYGASGLTWTWNPVMQKLTLNTTAYQASMTDLVDNRGVPKVTLPPSLLGSGSTLSTNYLSTGTKVGDSGFWPVFEQFTQKMGDFYRAHGWQDNVCWYMMDEIYEEHYPLIAEIAERAKGLFPELEILLVTNDMPDYLAENLDIWVVPWHFAVTGMDDVPHWDTLRSDGLTLFAYMNSLYMINANWSFRAMRFYPTVLAKYGYQGNLWWAMAQYAGGDPWVQACASSSDPANNKYLYGSGYLIYPPRDGETTWHSSMRWENYRQGLDEFDMLTILAARWRQTAEALGLSQFPAEIQQSLAADQAIRHWGALLSTEFRLQSYRSDGAYIHRFRQLLAHEIEALPAWPLVLLDCPLTGWSILQDRVTLTGICDAGTVIQAGGMTAGSFDTSQAAAFTIEYPLAIGSNLITILAADKDGHAKVIYREVVREP